MTYHGILNNIGQFYQGNPFVVSNGPYSYLTARIVPQPINLFSTQQFTNPCQFNFNFNNPFLTNSNAKPTQYKLDFDNKFAKDDYVKVDNPSISRLVSVAKAEKGVSEIGKSNDSERIRVYKNGAKNNYQWCAAFTSWCLEQAFGSKNPFKYTYSSQNIMYQAGSHFAKKNTYRPKMGDIAIWTNVNDKAHGHVGIVTKITDKGVYITEGNSGNQVKENFYTYEKLEAQARFNGYVKTREMLA